MPISINSLTINISMFVIYIYTFVLKGLNKYMNCSWCYDRKTCATSMDAICQSRTDTTHNKRFPRNS